MFKVLCDAFLQREFGSIWGHKAISQGHKVTARLLQEVCGLCSELMEFYAVRGDEFHEYELIGSPPRRTADVATADDSVYEEYSPRTCR